mgnify:FL=1
MVAVDWSFRLGDVISVAMFTATGMSAIFLMRGKLGELAVRIGFLEETVKTETADQNHKIDKQSSEIGKLGEIVTTQGRFDERLMTLRRDVDELRHGRGFVVPPPIKGSG